MKPCYDDEHNSSLDTSDSSYPLSLKGDPDLCQGCDELITGQYLLRVNGYSWHMSCLRCSVCQIGMDRQPSCFMKDGHVYCAIDYAREFGTKCARCFRGIHATDWVRRAKNHVYHLACFACDSCKRQLSTGEEFALEDNRLLCKSHYVELIEGGEDRDSDGGRKTKTKRVRTTFTDEQVSVLQANFQLESNPDGQDLERIAQITGLSKRVTQVWFQNSRARQKKHQLQTTDSGNVGKCHNTAYESTGEVTSPGSIGSSPPSHPRGYPPSPPMWRADCLSTDGLSFSD